MKKLGILLAASVLLAACKNNGNKMNEADEIAANMEPAIQGSWIMTDYINSLQQTKSPLASSKVLTDVVSLDIDTKGHTGDSATVSASLNNHEGYVFSIYLRKGHEDNCIPTGHKAQDGTGYELGYTVGNNDTTLVLYHYSNDGKLLDKRDFKKWKQPVADYDEPSVLQRTTNKILFAGTYKVTDDAGKAYEWKLSDGGVAIGVEGHNTFYVFTDFIAEEAGYLVDEMCFDEHQKTQKPYIFSIKGDTTFLYQAKENEERTKLEQGPLKYTLVKQ